jgi:p-cumate 2,3-dioxygenase beta subunit
MTDISRSEIEDFLYAEADLLDSWQLDKWLGLFTDDGQYLVPAADLPADASPDTSLFYIADDRFRLGERVARLMKKTAHSEYPRSKTRHFVTQVRLGEREADTLAVTCNFLCYRTKDGRTDQYWGRAYYQLLISDGAIRIRSKRCVLDLEGLIAQGRITVIL